MKKSELLKQIEELQAMEDARREAAFKEFMESIPTSAGIEALLVVPSTARVLRVIISEVQSTRSSPYELFDVQMTIRPRPPE